MKDIICSVIIPAYNAEKYISRCCDSLINQTAKEIEFIFIDDGSTDNTNLILQEYAKKDNRIRIITQKNMGVSCARNTGLKDSKGEYFCFLDSDDFVHTEFCDKLLPLLELHTYDVIWYGIDYVKNDMSNSDALDGEIISIDSNQLEHLKACTLYYDSKLGDKDNSLCAISVSTAGGVCYKKSHQTVNDIWFDDSIKLHEDGIFNFQMLKFCEKSVYIRQRLYCYRMNVDSASHTAHLNMENKFETRNQKAKQHITELYKIPIEETGNEFVQRYYASLIFQIAEIFEKEIFNFDVKMSFLKRKSRFKEIYKNKNYCELLNVTQFDSLASRESLVLKQFLDKKFVKIYLYYYLRSIYSMVRGKLKKQ